MARLHSLSRQDWSTASPTRRVRMMLLSGLRVSENLLAASFGGSHRALPCSSPWRKLPAARTARLQASQTAAAQAAPVPARLASPLHGPLGPAAGLLRLLGEAAERVRELAGVARTEQQAALARGAVLEPLVGEAAAVELGVYGPADLLPALDAREVSDVELGPPAAFRPLPGRAARRGPRLRLPQRVREALRALARPQAPALDHDPYAPVQQLAAGVVAEVVRHPGHSLPSPRPPAAPRPPPSPATSTQCSRASRSCLRNMYAYQRSQRSPRRSPDSMCAR